MSESNKSAQPVDPEAAISTTEEVFRPPLSEHWKADNDNQDALANPELDQFFGTLLMGKVFSTSFYSE